jgi:hypothetical protein
MNRPWLFATREKNPFGTTHLYQRFIRAKSPLYLIRGPTLVVSVGHFPFAFSLNLRDLATIIFNR